jgi:hypothetical protein
MIQRKTIPAQGDYSIAVASEKMRDGKWSAVATLQQSTAGGQRNIDLPVSEQRFDTEAEAERFVIDLAKAWIDRNAPPDTQP